MADVTGDVVSGDKLVRLKTKDKVYFYKEGAKVKLKERDADGKNKKAVSITWTPDRHRAKRITEKSGLALLDNLPASSKRHYDMINWKQTGIPS